MPHRRLFPFVLFCLACLAPQIRSEDRDQSGPAITLQSTVYQVGDTWHCPLCNQPVAHGDRSGWDTRRSLSEWHDILIDEDYFAQHIRYISDEELVASLDIPAIQPALQAALEAGDHDRLSMLLRDYFAARPDNGRLSTYDRQNKKHFITIDEFRRDVLADTARFREIVRSAREVYTPEAGFTLHGVHWGRTIDWNHTYPTVSKYGVHYLSFLDNQIAHYLLTGDADIARAFGGLFDQWYDQQDSVKQQRVIHQIVVYDFIWYELGLANRTQRLMDAERTFARELSPETHTKLLKTILGSARWLAQCLEKTPFHPYNWQTHTAFTLSYAALAFPEFRDAQAWLDRGRNTMILHLENDILDDGGYVERTPSYAEYMFSIFYRYMMMLEYFAEDPSLRERYLSRLENYIQFFVLTNAPVGVNTPFNDARRSTNLVPLFRDMGEFFGRGDFIGAVRHEFSPELLASLPVTVTDPAITSIDFPDSRFVVMRDSWDTASYFMILNYGEWQNHSHYDHLDVEIYANGIPIALDAGIGALGYLDSLHLTWYKHPLSHNMLTINRAVPVKRNIAGYDKVWSPQTGTEVFAATHDGYLQYQHARHRRHVVFAKERYWLIIDEVETAGKNQDMEFNLHTPCSMTPVEGGFVSAGEPGFLIVQDRRDASATTRTKSEGLANLAGLEGEPDHRAIDWLVFAKTLSGDPRADRMATLIFPYASSRAFDPASVSVERMDVKDDAATAYRITTPEGEDLIILSDGAYRAFTDGITGDFTYARISTETGRVVYAGLTGVTAFAIKGVTSQTFPSRRDYEYGN